MENVYDSLEELSEIEWLHHRPETYIGTVDHPTHLFEEVFDNSLDEVLNNSANIVVKIKDDYCEITDTGRGIPIGKDDSGVPYLVKACTKLYTSGKFNKKVKAYKISAGLNGIGLTAVTGLSDKTIITSSRDNQSHEYIFKTCFKTSKITYDEVKIKDSQYTGTTIKFFPSKAIFRSIKFDIDYIKERIHLVKMLTDADIKLYIDDVLFDITVDKNKLLETFFIDAIDQDTYRIKIKNNEQVFNISFYLDHEKNEAKFKGSVNLLPVHDGTHIKYFKSIFPDVLLDALPKNKILLRSDCLIGVRTFIECNLKEPRFGGQTKLKLDVDVKKFDIFTNDFKKELIKLFKTEVDLKSWYERLIDYKQGLNVKKSSAKLKKRKFSASLLDCVKHGKDSVLFIVEGDSAAGSLIKCRDRNKHAIFTLFGKSMPNVENCNKVKLLGNKTVIDLFSILGKDHDESILKDTSQIRYGQIRIATDPDIDGYHITIMVLKFFNKFFPKLIEEGKILLPKIPLYGYYENKNFIPVYDNQEALKIMQTGKKLMRHKGLGEFDSSDLEIVLFKKNMSIVVTKKLIHDLVTLKNENDNLFEYPMQKDTTNHFVLNTNDLKL